MNLPPFRQLTPLRVQSSVARLAALIWSEPRPLAVEATAPRPDHLPLAAARRLPRQAVEPGSAWGQLYDQRWCRVVLPREDRGSADRWMRWDEQGEATLFVDGTAYFGFDVAHRVCRLPAGVKEVWVESLAVQSAIWHPDAKGLGPEGNVFAGAQLLRRHDEAWEAWHDLDCLYDLMLELRVREQPGEPRELFSQTVQAPLTDVSPLYRRLLAGLDEALDAWDATGQIGPLRRRLARLYAELREERPLVKAAVTGHSHLDLVWLWTEQVGEGKAVHTFANANHLMDEYPEFRFAYSQPASYEAVARREPGLARAVGARLAAGQWEATGAMYVESDSHVACGEGLARSFILGQEAFVGLTGRRSRLLWLPDLFGFSACLPQLMRLSGVDYFFTTKTTWNTAHRFPYSSFRWRGPGGHEVLSHVTQGVQFNNTVSVGQLLASSRRHQQGDQHDEYLFPTGWGDGGGGPTAEMCERVRRLGALRELPALRWDQPEAFFDRLARCPTPLPAHDGEIYLEYHRGTFTTRAPVKARFRALERALQTREAALAVLGRAPGEDVAHAWRRSVFAQFHDYIPGSSIPEVYETGLPELARLAEEQTAAAARDLGDGARPAGPACVFNPLPLARTAVVDGRVVELAPLAGVVSAELRAVAAAPVTVKGRTLDNGRVTARLDARGRLAGLRIDGREVALAGPAGQLVLYPEQPANFGPWDIDRHSLRLAQPVRSKPSFRIETDGIAVTWSVGRGSTATVGYRLEPGSPVLRLTVTLDWQEPDTLLKLHFPTAYRAREVRAGTPFGSVLRPQLVTHPQVETMWEWPMSRWATVHDEGERAGLFVATENKYGVSCRDGDLGITLLRTPPMVGYEEHAKAYPAHLSRLPRPEQIHSDLGTHVIELALGFYDATAPREDQPAARAETLFTPVLPYRGAPVTGPWHGIQGGDTLIPHWVKPEADGAWTLRLHEVAGQRGEAWLDVAAGWTVQPVNLLGEPQGRPLRGGRLPFTPYEIVSLRFTRPA